MKKTKTRRLRPWTGGEVKELRMFSRRRIPVPDISRKLKRTEGALRQKAFQLGLSLGHQQYGVSRR